MAVVAFGVLGDEEQAWQDHATAVRLAEVNYVAPVGVGVCLAQVMRRQGHGRDRRALVGRRRTGPPLELRVRRSKAGMDGFFLGLGEALRGTARACSSCAPASCSTKMTEGRDAAPLSVTAEQVADAVTTAVAKGDDLVWVPKRCAA